MGLYKTQDTNPDFRAWLDEIHEDAAVAWDRDVPPEIIMQPFYPEQLAWEYVGKTEREPTVWVETTREHGRWWEFVLVNPDGSYYPHWRSDVQSHDEYYAALQRHRDTMEA